MRIPSDPYSGAKPGPLSGRPLYSSVLRSAILRPPPVRRALPGFGSPLLPSPGGLALGAHPQHLTDAGNAAAGPLGNAGLYSGTLAGGIPQTPGAAGPDPYTQATSQVEALIKAQLGLIDSRYAPQASNAANAIAAYNASAAKLLSGDSSAPYAGAEQSQAMLDSALQQSLTGQGSSLASQLASQLGGVDQGTVDRVTGDIAGQGTGAGNAAFASGSASLANLIANSASAGQYDKGVPGLIALAGSQNLGQALGTMASNRAQEEAGVVQQEPSLIQQAFGTLSSAANSRASLDAANQRFNITEGDKINLANQAHSDKVAGINERWSEFNVHEGDVVDIANQKHGDAMTAHKDAVTKDKALATYRQKLIDAAGDRLSEKRLNDLLKWASTNAVELRKDGQYHYTAAGAALLAKATGVDPSKWASSVVSGKTPPKPVVIGDDKAGRLQWDPKTQTWNKIPGSQAAPTPPKPFTSGGGIYQQQPDGTLKTLKEPPVKATTPKVIGSSKSGYFQLDPTTGKWNPIPGTKAKGAAGKVGGSLTQNEIDQRITSWHDGSTRDVRVPVTKNGEPVTNNIGVPQYVTQTQEGIGKLTYQQAVDRLVGLKVPRADAIQAVNGHYAMGDGGRPYEGQAAVAEIERRGLLSIKHGISLRDTLQAATASNLFPPALLRKVLGALYGQFPNVGTGQGASGSVGSGGPKGSASGASGSGGGAFTTRTGPPTAAPSSVNPFAGTGRAPISPGAPTFGGYGTPVLPKRPKPKGSGWAN